MFIEIPGTVKDRRFINVSRISMIILKDSGELWLEPSMTALVKGDKSYQQVLSLLDIKEKPASGETNLLEEEEKKE